MGSQRWKRYSQSSPDKLLRVVILGAGFAGLYCALYLEKRVKKYKSCEILLIDRYNFHLFTPILHEVTSGSVEPRHVVWPIRMMCKGRHILFERRCVEDIDFKTSEVRTSTGNIPYDYLVIALGSSTNFYGNKEALKNCFEFKDLKDAIELRNHIIDLFEKASQEADIKERKRLLTFAIIGGGCTGVELISEIHDMVYSCLMRYYPAIAPSEIRLVLFEATDRLIPCVNNRLASLALEKLRLRRVDVRLCKKVIGARDGVIELDDKTKLDCGTVIWVAGVKAQDVIDKISIQKDKYSRIIVNEYLEVPSYPGVFAIGDCAHFEDILTKSILPPTAQVAVQQAKIVAINIDARIRQDEPSLFRFKYSGDLVSLGEHYGVAELYGLDFYGLIAWFLWRTFYLFKLVGIKNKIRVGIDWAIALFFEKDISKLEWR